MNDHQFLLASAYLDNELSPAERATAEADPVVMEGVARLRVVQAAVRDVPAPQHAPQQRAIAAAMAAAQQPATAHAAAPARARPWGRYLSIAAAVAAVGALGAVVANLGGSDDHDTAGDADVSLEAAQPDTVADARPTDADATSGAGDDAVGGAPTPAEEARPDADAEFDTELSAADDQADPMATSEPTDATDGRSDPVVPVTDPDQVLATPGELTGLGLHLRERYEARQLTTVETRCDLADVTPDLTILTRGSYLLDGTVTEILVAVDLGSGDTAAIDPETCLVLVAGVEP